MGLFARASVKAFDQGLGTLAGGRHVAMMERRSTVTGRAIGMDSAMAVSAFWACVRTIAESAASLPLIVYRRLPGGGKERAVDHWLYPVLHDAANPEMSAFTAIETALVHATTWGNLYAAKAIDGSGRVRELWPLRPDRMEVTRIDGELRYGYTTIDGQRRELRRSEVLHVPGLSFDGLTGYSILTMARNALAVGKAAEEYGGRFFERDARPGIVLTHPKSLSDTARTNIETSWQEKYGGPSNAGGFGLLEEGMSLKEIGIPPEDAQFLETRKFQAIEIARFFRMPPHMIGELDRATFSNIEQQAIEFVVYTLRPWLVRLEKAMGQQLLRGEWIGAGGDLFIEFLVDGLLRGDSAARATYYHQGRIDGWLNGDEIREMENRNPMPDGQGQIFLAPQNTAPLDLLAAILAGRATANPIPSQESTP